MMTGADLKDMRRINNMTQQELADALDVSARTVQDWERLPEIPRITELACSVIFKAAPKPDLEQRVAQIEATLRILIPHREYGE